MNAPTNSAQSHLPSTSSHSRVGTTVGGILGGVVGFLVTAIGFRFVHRRTKNAVEFGGDGNNGHLPGAPAALMPYYLHYDSVDRSGSQPDLHLISSSGVFHSSGYGYPAVGGSGGTTQINPAGSKVAMHREELSRLTNLQNKRDAAAPSNSLPVLPPLAPLSPPSGEDADANVATQVADLQREVKILRSQQQQILEINEVPPPQYDSEAGTPGFHAVSP